MKSIAKAFAILICPFANGQAQEIRVMISCQPNAWRAQRLERLLSVTEKVNRTDSLDPAEVLPIISVLNRVNTMFSFIIERNMLFTLKEWNLAVRWRHLWCSCFSYMSLSFMNNKMFPLAMLISK